MKYLGIFLVILGIVVAAGYAIFLIGKWFFRESHIPIPFIIAITAIILGLVLWIIEAIREKFKEAGQRETPIIMDRNMQEMDDRELGRERR